ncbi:hypothetical protein [Paraburkholderia sp. XV]|uniref:hypothetical protein n=1 Tax=Paraburkholderia sp. XV TaxID=2831520 RepID=UPI001CD305F9|nr:hypothetical protein [Paraburkholderia sp. XV]
MASRQLFSVEFSDLLPPNRRNKDLLHLVLCANEVGLAKIVLLLGTPINGRRDIIKSSLSSNWQQLRRRDACDFLL